MSAHGFDEDRRQAQANTHSRARVTLSLMRRYFGILILLLLAGYAFLGKGFAYVGRYPLFVGEIGLVVAGMSSLAIVFRQPQASLRRLLRWDLFPLYAFVVWGAARTVPYLGSHGLNALRDGVLWGYSLFGLAIYLVFPSDAVQRFARVYRQVLFPFLLWLPVAFYFTEIQPFPLQLPGARVPLIFNRAGDVNVHLAGVGALLLLGVGLAPPGGRGRGTWTIWGLWLLWAAAWLLFGAVNRSGLFSTLAGLLAAALYVSPRRWLRPLAATAAVVFLLAVSGFRLSVASGPEVAQGQEVSLHQLWSNVATSTSFIVPELTQKVDNLLYPNRTYRSLKEGCEAFQVDTGESDRPTLCATVEWRLDWWRKIIGYTVNGPYRWTGKGYGVNLADDDGFQVWQDGSLRSPHNGTMTVLARSGLPGLILWLATLGTIAWQSIGTTLRSRQNRIGSWLLPAWLGCYLLALLFNASFDVVLESPMGGIWFWSLVGGLWLVSEPSSGGVSKSS